MTLDRVLPSGFNRARELMHAYDERATARTGAAAGDLHDLCTTQEEMVFAHLEDLLFRGQAVFWILTPDAVSRMLDYLPSAQASTLSDAERGRIVEAVMNDPQVDQILAEARERLNGLLGDHVRAYG